MRTVAEHQDAIRAMLAPLAARDPEWHESVHAPASAVPRVLALDVVTPIDLPPFTNSQMDGYAVRATEVVPEVQFAVAPRIAAGSGIGVLAPGFAAPIMTGAAMPAGADAVVPIERSVPDHFLPEDEAGVVGFADAVSPGSYVRPRGSDIAQGSLLLEAGTRLGAAQWGVLAASGITRVPLLRQLRVLVLSTGDELTEAGAPLEPGRIYDANSSSMAFALAQAGAVTTAVLVVPDSADVVRDALEANANAADLILTTGGVSQGAYEVVRDVFENAGVDFVSVAMQPGGPQGFGIARLGAARIPVVAFPGNPVSALVSFEMFLRPVLRALHGLDSHRPTASAPLSAPLESPQAKHQVRRGRLREDGQIELVGGASSHLLHSYAASTHLVHVPLGATHLDAGDTVEIWRIDD